MNLHSLTAHALLDLFRSGKASAREAYEAVLGRIKAVDPKVKAYISPVRNLPDFAGEFQIPIAIKDNLCTKGEEITCASRILKGFLFAVRRRGHRKGQEKRRGYFGDREHG